VLLTSKEYCLLCFVKKSLRMNLQIGSCLSTSEENAVAKTKEAFYQYKLKSPAIFDFYEGEAPLDWEGIKAAKPLRVAFQATYGRHGRHNDDTPDREVRQFVNEAKANGIKYGLYHFLTPRSIAEQADFYIKTVQSLGGLGDMEPIVDIEYEPNRKDKNAVPGAEWAGQIKAWLDLVEAAFGMKPMIYTSAKFWAFTFGRNNMPPEWTPNYRLWTAGYPLTEYVDKNTTCPPSYIPAGWKEWAIWQYAEDGRYRKYAANDLNLVSEDYVNVLNQNGSRVAVVDTPVAITDMPAGDNLTVPVSVTIPQESGTGFRFTGVSASSSISNLTYTVKAGNPPSGITVKLDMKLDLEFTIGPSKVSDDQQQFSINKTQDGTVELTNKPAGSPDKLPVLPATQPSGSESVSTVRYAIVKHIPRDVLPGKFAPDTVTMADAPKGTGKGKVIPILDSWWTYIAKINSAAGLKYARSVGMMWINIKYGEGETPKAERITCGGNFVSILEESGKHYRIDSFSNELKTGTLDPAKDNWFQRPEVFFKAIAINVKGDLINVAKGLDVYFPLLSRAGDALWIIKDKVELFPALPVEVVVSADTLNVGKTPGLDGEAVGVYAKGTKTRVLEYRPLGASVWGRTADGWINLLLADKSGKRVFPTDWKLDTTGVIPPPA